MVLGEGKEIPIRFWSEVTQRDTRSPEFLEHQLLDVRPLSLGYNPSKLWQERLVYRLTAKDEVGRISILLLNLLDGFYVTEEFRDAFDSQRLGF